MERLRAGGERNDRGWDGWMALPTRWTWVWVNSRSWWWTGRPGVLQFMGLQRVGWVTELNWREGVPLHRKHINTYTHTYKSLHRTLIFVSDDKSWILKADNQKGRQGRHIRMILYHTCESLINSKFADAVSIWEPGALHRKAKHMTWPSNYRS